MSRIYDFTTLTIGMASLPVALPALERTLPQAGGKLLGCWTADTGALNRVMILRAFESADELFAAREALARSEEPFGIAGGLEAVDSGSYRLFPWLADIEPAAHGRCYELRMYGLRFGRLESTIEAWKLAIPERSKISAFIGAMYAIDGAMPRFLNIWGYASAAARASARAEAVSKKIWPPAGGPTSVTTHMTSTLAIPTAFSPLC